MIKTLYVFLYSLILLPLIALAHEGGESHGTHLGKIHFPTSGNKNAQPFFETGVMWLHSFEYKEARENFQKAENIDPNFSMAYWGEAMTYNHPLWSEQDLNAGTDALKKLAPTNAERIQKANTPKEKGLMNAVNILYGKDDKKTRDRKYADLMRELYRQYPNDDEIASFYALALLGTTEGQRDFRIYMQAAGIAEEIFGRNPLHPGALHYAIHSYDDPIHAPLGLRAARAYAKMAPDASHALHMPSHIFLALGLWDDVIASNKAAWEAGVRQNISRDPRAYTIDDLHALEWLSYGYLEKHDFHTAYKLTKTMENIAEKTNSPMAKWYYGLMRAAYITETHNWNSNLKSLDMTNVELSASSSDLYTNGLIALNSNHDAAGIQAAKNILAKLIKKIPKHFSKNATYPDYFTSVTSSGITATNIMVLELQSHILLSEGKINQAIIVLKKAARLEDQTSFGYGPPIPVEPSYELLAKILLQEKKYGEAYRKYIIALKRMPNRTDSVLGSKEASDKLIALGLPVPEGIAPYFNKLLLPEYYH